ncbi:MAG TPA: NHL repeat-containing protein [Thermoanaerobaculia bacterium]
MIQTATNPDASNVRARRAALAAFGLCLAIAASDGCKRSETAAPGAPPASAAAATTAVPAPDAAPVIREAAEAGKGAWAGLAEPHGLALDGRGRLWVTDFGHSRVAIFDAAGGTLGGWGGVRGNGPYQLQDPADIAIHGDDVYVADTWNGRVQHYAISGKFDATTAIELYGPRGVAVAPDGVVWVADSGNNRLALIQAGQPTRFIGKAGAGADGLSSPVGLAISPSHVYVADIGNHRIQVLGLDGKFQRSFPVAAWKEAMEPYLAVDDKDNLYASVPAGSTVLALDRSGKVLHSWGADDAGKKLLKPIGIALDGKNGILYVADAASNAVTAIHVAGKKP